MRVAFVIGVSVVLGLLLLLIREVRHSSGPMEWGRTPRWAKRLRVTLDLIILLIGLLLFYGFLIEPGRLVVHEQAIELENWPKELSGLRIAVLADIHVDNWFITEKKVSTIVERTNQLQPDLIVILGDYMAGDGWVTRKVDPEIFAPLLKNLRAPYGVYSVLGNHDWWYDGTRVRRALEGNNIEVLDDEVLEINVRGTSLWLVGFADLWTRRQLTYPQHLEQTVAKVPEGAPVIALTHNPDIFPGVPQRVPIMLAGHTHAGQVRVPLIGSVVEASRYGEKYERGHVFENNHHLFVTTGIGTSIMPVRFGVTPEIVLLTLNSK